MSTSSLGEPFAVGHTAEVYAWEDGAWEDGTILKLFREWFPLGAIEHEARIARLVVQAGLPTPPVIGEILEVDGRYGIVYERVVGVSMLENLTAQPWTFGRNANLLAELQADIHSRGGVEGLPNQHEKLKAKIESAQVLPLNLRDAALAMLGGLPRGNQLCHGDFHADNVLITEDGPVIIDWIDATNGNPLADIARSSLLMSEAELPEDKRYRWLLNQFRDRFHRAYLKRTFQLEPSDRREFDQWRTVNAAARLSEGIPEEQALITLIEASFSSS